MIKVNIEADINEDELEIFLTAIRVFDKAFPGNHFKIASNGGSKSLDEMKAMLDRLDLPILYAGRKQ